RRTSQPCGELFCLLCARPVDTPLRIDHEPIRINEPTGARHRVDEKVDGTLVWKAPQPHGDAVAAEGASVVREHLQVEGAKVAARVLPDHMDYDEVEAHALDKARYLIGS